MIRLLYQFVLTGEEVRKLKVNFTSYSATNATLAGLAGFLYAVSFVILKDALLSSVLLMLGGLFSIPVVVALYGHLQKIEVNFARLALLLGIVGTFGSVIHGGYDLANVINPPQALNLDLPSQIDPRGLLAFGVMGLAILKISWLMGKSKQFPKNLSMLGFLSGLLLVLIYLARLTVLSPANPILLYPVLLEGFIVNPLWYLWLGFALRRKT